MVKTVSANGRSHSERKRSEDKGDLYARCKRGWNWRFVFRETARDGKAVTVVRRELLFRTKTSLETIVSGYPGGCREDSVVETIQDEIDNLKMDAVENDVAVHEVTGRNFDSLVIGAPINSEIVKRFAQSLSGIRRVVVDC